jgi:hypothetical protein
VAAMERTSQQKGKHAEYFVFGELLKRGAELYIPITDTGIDAILRRKDGTYIEIQVKGRIKENRAGQFGVWDLNFVRPDEKFFIVCVDFSKSQYEEKPEVWIFPSNIFMDFAIETTSKEGWKLYRIDVNARSKKHGNKMRRELLQQFLGAWELLTG